MTLPSGAVAPLEPPLFAAVLGCDGSARGLASCSLAHEEVDADSLCEDDAYAIAEWVVERFAELDEALVLGMACVAYGESPSHRLGITDPMLAFALDLGLMPAPGGR